MELVVTVKKTSEIEFNHEPLKTELKNALEKYRNLVYTDDSIKDAKADRAKLNALATAIEDKRKEIKKQCLEPYEQFEKKIKELTALIAAPCAEIDGQVKAFEARKKAEKKSELMAFTDLELNRIIPFKDKFPADTFITEKMLNSSVSIKNAKTEISEAITKVNEGIELIKTFPESRQSGLLIQFAATRDLAQVIKRNNEIDEMEKAQAKAKEIEQAKKLEKKPVEQKQDSIIDAPRVELMTFTLKLTGTKEKLIELRKYIAANGISYEKVE